MPTVKSLATRARAEGAVILLLALGYLWETRSIPSLYQMPGVPGPAAFPSILGLGLALAGLWRLLFGGGAADPDRGGEPAADAGRAGPRAPGAIAWLAGPGRFYALWAVILAFLALMPYAGFPIAAAVGLALMFRLLGERRWLVCAGLGLAATAVLYLGFAVGLGVRLPLGVLSAGK